MADQEKPSPARRALPTPPVPQPSAPAPVASAASSIEEETPKIPPRPTAPGGASPLRGRGGVAAANVGSPSRPGPPIGVSAIKPVAPGTARPPPPARGGPTRPPPRTLPRPSESSSSIVDRPLPVPGPVRANSEPDGVQASSNSLEDPRDSSPSNAHHSEDSNNSNEDYGDESASFEGVHDENQETDASPQHPEQNSADAAAQYDEEGTSEAKKEKEVEKKEEEEEVVPFVQQQQQQQPPQPLPRPPVAPPKRPHRRMPSVGAEVQSAIKPIRRSGSDPDLKELSEAGKEPLTVLLASATSSSSGLQQDKASSGEGPSVPRTTFAPASPPPGQAAASIPPPILGAGSPPQGVVKARSVTLSKNVAIQRPLFPSPATTDNAGPSKPREDSPSRVRSSTTFLNVSGGGSTALLPVMPFRPLPEVISAAASLDDSSVLSSSGNSSEDESSGSRVGRRQRPKSVNLSPKAALPTTKSSTAVSSIAARFVASPLTTPASPSSSLSSSVSSSSSSSSSSHAAGRAKKHVRAISMDLDENSKIEHDGRATFAGDELVELDPKLKKKNSIIVDHLNRINQTKKNVGPLDDAHKTLSTSGGGGGGGGGPSVTITSTTTGGSGLSAALTFSPSNVVAERKRSLAPSDSEPSSEDSHASGVVSAASAVGGKFVKRGRQVGKKLFEVATLGLMNEEMDAKGPVTKNPLFDGRITSKEKFAIPSLHRILDIMGLSESDISQVIEMAISKADKSVLKSDVISEKQMDFLKALKEESQKVIDAQLKTQGIVKVQSVIRSWLVHRKASLLVGSELSRQTHYNKIFTHIVDRERRYIAQLRQLSDRFLTPIRARSASGKEILRLEETTFLFCNVEMIMEEHKRNLRRLESLYDMWPHVANVGHVFLELAPSLKAYHVYISNFKNAQDTLSRLKAEKGKFFQFLQEVSQRHPDTNDLLSLISAPIHHLSKLEPLFETLAEFSRPGSDDQREANNAFALLSQTNVFMNQSLIVNTADLVNIQRKITGYDGPLNLVVKDRELVMEGAVAKRYIYLFNDVLLVTSLPDKKGMFKYKQMFPLEVVNWEESSEKNTFVIKTPTEIYKNLTKTPEEKQQWVTALRDLFTKRKKNRTFGVLLEDLLKREQRVENGIPSIIEICIETIKKLPGGLDAEGLFRISGEKRELNAMHELFDNLEPESINLASMSIHSISGIIKQWFRELPEPLMTFNLYDKFISTERTFEDDPSIEPFKSLLLQLPGPNLKLLKYLITFLARVCENSDVNKMTPSNLAIVFGPTLMRPKTETIESTLNSPLVNHVIQRFIEQSVEFQEINP